VLFSGKWMELEIIMLSEISHSQKEISHIAPPMQNLHLKIYITVKEGLFEGSNVQKGER
jgi:hypothetical protein